jgi:hypothetical protein
MSSKKKGHVVENVKSKLPKKIGTKKRQIAKNKKIWNKKKAPCKKSALPKHQPICGLYAIACCIGRRLHTANDVEAFREECKAVTKRNGNWVGRTGSRERITICNHFGFDALQCDFQSTTVGRLFRNAAFFKTREKWLLCVRDHCLFVQTHKTKAKLYAMDQRGNRMYYHKKEPALNKIMRQAVKSVHRVEPMKVATEAIWID